MRNGILLTTDNPMWTPSARARLAVTVARAGEVVCAMDLPCENPDCEQPSHVTLLMVGEPNVVEGIAGADGHAVRVALVAEVLQYMPELLAGVFGADVVGEAMGTVMAETHRDRMVQRIMDALTLGDDTPGRN